MRSIPLKLVFTALVVIHLVGDDARAQGVPDVSQLALPGGPAQISATPSISRPSGDVQVVVQLSDAPLAAAHGRNAKQIGGRLSPRNNVNTLSSWDRRRTPF